MKLQNYIFLLLPFLALSLTSCSNSEESTPPAAAVVDTTAIPPLKDSLITLKPTETFSGTYQEKEVVFSHYNFKAYSLSIAGVITKGLLTNERGYGDDPNATVYVLNSDKPKNERSYIVRTPNGSVYMLDKDRYVMDDATFEPVKGPIIKPPVAEKPKVEKSVKEEAAVKKTEVTKTAVKKSAAKKAVKTKKISKVKKKKKPVKKVIKKKRKKKKKSVNKSSAKEPTKPKQ